MPALRLQLPAFAAMIVLASCASLPGQSEKVDAAPLMGPAIYSNMEEVYFDKEAKKDAAPWLSVKIDDTQEPSVSFIDAYGQSVKPAQNWTIQSQTDDRLTLTNGTRTTELRRARPVICWAAVKKDAPKADGTPDWHFEQELNFHDQGGRARFGGGTTGAQEAIIRIRYVTWAAGSTNRPSLVLYVMKPDAPDDAVSYSWADEGAARIGINLRWMQASCTIEGAEKASAVDDKNFRR